MKNLEQLQNNFVEYLYNQRNANIFSSIKDGKIPATEGMGVYTNNLQSFLIYALKLTYPGIFESIGEKKFNKYAKEYISENRSYSTNLDDYGEYFLQKENVSGFLKDLSKMEWIKQKAYLVKDVTPLDATSLQGIAPEKLFDVKFKIHPSFNIIDSFYNLEKLAKKKNKNIGYYIVYRNSSLKIVCEKITKKQKGFLDGIQKEMTLYEIYTECKVDIQESLRHFVSNGILCEFYF